MIILSMLGTSNYTKTCYTWGDDKTCETRFPQVALASWYPDATVKVLVTEGASKKQGDEWHAGIPNIECVPILDGKEESELWANFNTVADLLRDGEDVILDITHGYRSLPAIVLMALAFLRIAKNVNLRHVVYGRFDPEEPEVSPIFDLTPFITMLDWAVATDRFLDTGDARKFKPLLDREKEYNPLSAVARKMYSLSEALFLHRAERSLNDASELKKKIEKAKSESWKQHYAPLQLLIDPLVSRTAGMAAASELSAQFAQIEWLVSHQHYPSAACLAREWIVSVRVKLNGSVVFPASKEPRELAENWLNENSHSGEGFGLNPEAPAEWREMLVVWAWLGDTRNDLMHFGMRKRPDPPDGIRDRIRALPEQLRSAVKPLGLDIAGT